MRISFYILNFTRKNVIFEGNYWHIIIHIIKEIQVMWRYSKIFLFWVDIQEVKFFCLYFLSICLKS